MKASERVAALESLLRRHDYEVIADWTGGNYCFDVIANSEKRRGLVLRLAENAEKCSRQTIRELKKLALTLDGLPLLISDRIGKRELEVGIFYKRHGLFVLNERTFDYVISNEEVPFVYADKGGLYVKLNSEKLKKARVERGLSLGELAQRIGVTRRTVYEYERGNMDATFEVAIRLEEVLDADVVESAGRAIQGLRVDVERECRPSGDEAIASICRVLERAGFETWIFRKTPFDIAAKKTPRSNLIIKSVRKGVDKEEISLMSEIAEVMRARALIVVRKRPAPRVLGEGDRIDVVDEKSLEKVCESLAGSRSLGN